MAHSYIIGEGLEFEVRDSICESVLEGLKNQLKGTEGSPSALRVVSDWFDYWYATPPGCKELTLEQQPAEVRAAIVEALSEVTQTFDPASEHLMVANLIETILTTPNATG